MGMLYQVNQNAKGISALFFAHVIWGLLPLYLKTLEHISPFEILAHRIVWSALFTFILMLAHKNRKILSEMLKERKKDVLWLAVGGFIISFNWGIYIWAINHGRILESSLGYFINPLVCMFFGMMFFNEKLNKIQTLALVLAFLGVSAELVTVGSIPLVSIGLALSFGLYGVLKKAVKAPPAAALFIETLTVSPIALAWLMFLQRGGFASFPYDVSTNILLTGTGIVSSIPLMLFAYSAARVPLTTMGFVQYVTPTLSFMLGVFVYDEPMQASRIFTFIFIWIALAIYSTDALSKNRRRLGNSRI